MTEGSQKFIARNRAPRVQIEYDVELYGSEKKVQLPFVMGVMSDLSGKSKLPQPPIEDRRFLEIDVDSFDERMKAMQPRAAFSVPNTLTGEGALSVDLTFEKMDDFTPAAIAARIEPLRTLLEARTQLSNLATYMDGKAGAEALIERILADPALLGALAGGAKGVDHSAALESLRAAELPEEESEEDSAILDSLRAQAPAEVSEADATGDVLAGLAQQRPAEANPPDRPADVLSELRARGDALEVDADAGLDDALTSLRTDAAPEDTQLDGQIEDTLASLAKAHPIAEDRGADVEDVLASLPATSPDEPAAEDTQSVLSDLAAATPSPPEVEDDLDDFLGSLDAEDKSAPEPEQSDDLGVSESNEAGAVSVDDDALDDLMSDAQTPEPQEAEPEGLDDLLADVEDPADTSATPVEPQSADTDDLDDLLAGIDAPAETEPEPADPQTAELDDLDDLLGEIENPADANSAQQPVQADDLSDLDGLLSDAEPANAPMSEPVARPAAEVDEPAADDDLGNLLDDLDMPAAVTATSAETTFAFGSMTAERPGREALNRARFRIAILGDFSGRAARGEMATGNALAGRAPVLLDPDTVEEVIEGFATRLTLPIGKDGTAVEVPLNGLDDLHPDELFDNISLFADLAGLRTRLAAGATAENAARELRAWGEAHGTPVAPPRRTSAGSSVPAGLKLTDFQRLIGDTRPQPPRSAPIDDLLARIVGPHVRALPDADAAAMQAAVDDALSSAMRMILHHPEFQSVEAQWRSLDLIARSIETDDRLEVVLYDVSAEEIAADLAAAGDLARSGFARLLTEAPLDPENGRGGYSALIGLYTFEETPPHADLLGRIARVAAHVDTPFLAALSPACLDTPKEDRHPLVATAWDGLRAMPEAGHLGLATPRFLLRRPYGAKSDPISAFKFEEFTMTEGLSGMLWANPVVLAAILLAKSFRENGASMELGSIMSLGHMPYHVVTDRHGDQVALPCTERNLTLERVEKVMTRGLMPVVSIKGRDEIRLASFQSLAGGQILGPWSDVAPPPPSPPKPTVEPTPEDDLGLDDLLAGFDADAAPAAGADPGDVDAELAALLEDL